MLPAPKLSNPLNHTKSDLGILEMDSHLPNKGLQNAVVEHFFLHFYRVKLKIPMADIEKARKDGIGYKLHSFIMTFYTPPRTINVPNEYQDDWQFKEPFFPTSKEKPDEHGHVTMVYSFIWPKNELYVHALTKYSHTEVTKLFEDEHIHYWRSNPFIMTNLQNASPELVSLDEWDSDSDTTDVHLHTMGHSGIDPAHATGIGHEATGFQIP